LEKANVIPRFNARGVDDGTVLGCESECAIIDLVFEEPVRKVRVIIFEQLLTVFTKKLKTSSKFYLQIFSGRR
jgi:hypothetical protein